MKFIPFQQRLTGLILIVALVGCAYVTTTQEFNPYVGKPIAFAINQYGPASSKETTNGETFYSWDDIERHHAGAFPGVESICKLTMMVDASGIVTAYTIRKTGGMETLDSCR